MIKLPVLFNLRELCLIPKQTKNVQLYHIPVNLEGNPYPINSFQMRYTSFESRLVRTVSLVRQLDHFQKWVIQARLEIERVSQVSLESRVSQASLESGLVMSAQKVGQLGQPIKWVSYVSLESGLVMSAQKVGQLGQPRKWVIHRTI